jgi:hypothetical protein
MVRVCRGFLALKDSGYVLDKVWVPWLQFFKLIQDTFRVHFGWFQLRTPFLELNFPQLIRTRAYVIFLFCLLIYTLRLLEGLSNLHGIDGFVFICIVMRDDYSFSSLFLGPPLSNENVSNRYIDSICLSCSLKKGFHRHSAYLGLTALIPNTP